jgi:putative transposase
VNGILKDEYDLHTTFNDYLDANEAVKSAVHKYNNLRPHASCDYLVPAEAHKQTGDMRKRWYPRKEKPVEGAHAFDHAKVT